MNKSFLALFFKKNIFLLRRRARRAERQHDSVPVRGSLCERSMEALPLAFIIVLSATRNLDPNQSRAAASLGARAVRIFISVELPQFRFAVFAGAMIAFLASFDETVIALFVGGGAANTLPRMMYSELRMALDPTIAAASTVMLGFASVFICASQAMNVLQRRLKR